MKNTLGIIVVGSLVAVAACDISDDGDILDREAFAMEESDVEGSDVEFEITYYGDAITSEDMFAMELHCVQDDEISTRCFDTIAEANVAISGGSIDDLTSTNDPVAANLGNGKCRLYDKANQKGASKVYGNNAPVLGAWDNDFDSWACSSAQVKVFGAQNYGTQLGHQTVGNKNAYKVGNFRPDMVNDVSSLKIFK
ncbi:MAG: hypothetical protein AAGF11_09565 [Myxococcota bacterium]